MNWLSRKIQEWRRARESLAMARQFHVESRARIEKMLRDGRGAELAQENATLLGIDLNDKSRPRVKSVGGIDFD